MNTEKTTLSAWKMAIRNRSVEKGLIFHSDRGVQYSNKKFANTIESYGVIRSMREKEIVGIMQ
jgi:transposase InsO family protein